MDDFQWKTGGRDDRAHFFPSVSPYSTRLFTILQLIVFDYGVLHNRPWVVVFFFFIICLIKRQLVRLGELRFLTR